MLHVVSRDRWKKGFTYIEALASIVLTSLLVAGVLLSSSTLQNNLNFSWKSVSLAERSEVVRAVMHRAMDMSAQVLVTPYMGPEQDWSHLPITGPRSHFGDLTYETTLAAHISMWNAGDTDYSRGFTEPFFPSGYYGRGFTLWFVTSDERAIAWVNIFQPSGLTRALRVQAFTALDEGGLYTADGFGYTASDLTANSDLLVAEYTVEYAATAALNYRSALTPLTYYLGQAVSVVHTQGDPSSGLDPCLVRLPSPYDVDAVESHVLLSPQSLFVEHASSLLVYARGAEG